MTDSNTQYYYYPHPSPMRHPIWFSIPSALVVNETVPAAEKTDGFAQARPNFGGMAG